MIYSNLRAEMSRKGLNILEMSQKTGIGYQSLKAKLQGKSDFRLNEMRSIKSIFPTESMDYLFRDVADSA